ncbi:signal peptidase I [Salinirubrum litoreum]|uniref:Signal peptidase I n=1 Tax=Salinirubrum litoreum TaxID=1126234 RepID=A0ABD5R9T0_9EURY|nr:signal peptidase I [Salinirubrum litoreum]
MTSLSRFTGGRWGARNVLALLLLLALLAPFAVYAVPGVIGADQSYVVLTGSMEPAISPGDAVVVDAVDPASIVAGDVITFQRSAANDIPTTHRVMDVVNGDAGLAFVTKGDANEDVDASVVTPDRVVGKVVLTIPFIGYVVQFVNSPLGFVALVVIPFGLLLITEVWSMIRGNAGASRRDTEPGVGADATTTGAAYATDGESARADEPTGPDDDNLTFSQRDLAVAAVVLAVAALFSGYFAYERREAWLVAVAVAATTTFLLVVGLRQFGGDDPTADGTVQAGAGITTTASAAVPQATIPAAIRDLPTVTLADATALVTLGRDTGHPVVHDPETDEYVLIDAGTVYTAPAPQPEPDPELAADVDADDTLDASMEWFFGTTVEPPRPVTDGGEE